MVFLTGPIWTQEEETFCWISLGAGYLKPSAPRMAYQVEGKSQLLFYCLRMQAGVLTEGWNSMYAYGGIGYETNILGRLYFYPSFSPGVYFKGNHGIDLGFPIEFRSCLEVFIKMNDSWRIGGEFFHLSNAHLGHHNPGVNGVIFYVATTFSSS